MALLMVPLVNGILGVIYIPAGLILWFWPVIDTLKRCLGDTGERFKKAIRRLGVECRCEQRQAYLNVRFPYVKQQLAQQV